MVINDDVERLIGIFYDGFAFKVYA